MNSVVSRRETFIHLEMAKAVMNVPPASNAVPPSMDVEGKKNQNKPVFLICEGVFNQLIN